MFEKNGFKGEIVYCELWFKGVHSTLMEKTQHGSWRLAGHASAVQKADNEEEMKLGYQASGLNPSDPLTLLPPWGCSSQRFHSLPRQCHQPRSKCSNTWACKGHFRANPHEPPMLPIGCVVSLALFSTFTQRSTYILFYPSLCLSCQRDLKKCYISVGISLREVTRGTWGYLSGQVRKRWLSHLSQVSSGAGLSACLWVNCNQLALCCSQMQPLLPGCTAWQTPEAGPQQGPILPSLAFDCGERVASVKHYSHVGMVFRSKNNCQAFEFH